MRTCTTSASPSNSALVLALAATVGCAGGDIGGDVPDTSLESLSVSDVQPRTVVPGSSLVIEGSSFVDAPWGISRLRLQGSYGGSAIDVAVSLSFVDYDRMAVAVDPDFTSALGGDQGEFVGQATVEVDSSYDGRTYVSDPIDLSLTVERRLTPRLDLVQTGGVIFVNDAIEVQGGGLLLGGDEGTTFAVVDGCFTPEGQVDCAPVSRTDVPVVPASEFDRTRGSFAFGPTIAGIRPGAFTGTVELRNDHAGGETPTSESKSASYDIIPAAIFDISPTAASLGQFVVVRGGGFVGGDDNGDTLVEMQGNFAIDGGPTAPVDLLLVPEFVSGNTVRYVLNEDDSLGQSIDLRMMTGEFTGTVRPVVNHAGDEVVGTATTVTLRIAPVKQVVYLEFLPSYVESLRSFGLRAVDAQIRQRVLAVARRDFATVNVELRLEPPDDFALYSRVEIAGPDPNGLGLLGYDNTPGKDTGNARLYDRIGGVNALTQEDGFPGYGGVFIESMFGFSEHPGDFAEKMPGSDPAFDDVFDHVRPDRGGKPVIAADLAAGVPMLTDGAGCPAGKDRGDRVGCAVFVLGSLIGTTVTHELGHSLGLANPYGEGFHNVGDAPSRLMDSGASRPFPERAELFDTTPSRFCGEEYDYLRQILPTSEPADNAARPSCF